MSYGIFNPRQRDRGVALTTHAHLAPRYMEVELYLYSLLGFHGLYWCDIYLYFMALLKPFFHCLSLDCISKR